MVQSTSTILYVNPTSGNDGGSGTQAAPFKTITRALQQARAGTTIQLSLGTYSAATGEKFPLVIPSGVTVLGNEASKGSGILVTGSGSFLSPTFASQNVTFRMENNSQLRGVTVTNPEIRGTAVWVESTNPAIASNTFINNKREGVFATGTASPAVLDNVAIQNASTGFTIVRNAKGEWRRNVCQKTGFGFAISDHAAPLLADNRIVENRSGIVLNRDCKPVLRANLIEKNTEVGLVVAERAFPDLGKSQDPAGNILRDNAQFDLQNATAATLLSVGNQINPLRVQGAVDLVANEVPPPLFPRLLPPPAPPPQPGLLILRGTGQPALFRGWSAGDSSVDLKTAPFDRKIPSPGPSMRPSSPRRLIYLPGSLWLIFLMLPATFGLPGQFRRQPRWAFWLDFQMAPSAPTRI
jgi:hypothetical protein